jgi:hypothetical protein
VVDAAVAMADLGTLPLADNARLAASVSRVARMSGIDVEG